MSVKVRGYLAKNKGVVWRDIAGEVVIVGEDGSTVRTLNRTASLIWSLADGTRQLEAIVAAMHGTFEVTPQQARADAEEFCSQLLNAGLLSLGEFPQEG